MTERDVTAEQALAWEMRRSGASVREIAGALGCSVSTAHERIKAVRNAEESTEPLDRTTGRLMEAARLEHYTAVLEPLLASDPLATVPVLLKVSAARRALLGLDMPARIAIEHDKPRTCVHPDVDLAAEIRQAQYEAKVRRAEIRGEPIPDDEAAP